MSISSVTIGDDEEIEILYVETGEKGDKGDTGQSAYEAYEATTTDDPVLTFEEWNTANNAHRVASEAARDEAEAAKVAAESAASAALAKADESTSASTIAVAKASEAMTAASSASASEVAAAASAITAQTLADQIGDTVPAALEQRVTDLESGEQINLNLTANHLVQKVNGVDAVIGVNALQATGSVDIEMLGMIPSGWLGIRDFPIFDDGVNFTTAVDSLEGWRDHHRLPEGKAYYVNAATGSDSNDGLTAGSAFASISKVLTFSDYDTVYVEAGIYPRDKGFTVPPNRSSNWIATNGTVFVGSHDYQQVVTAHATLPNVWQFSRTSVECICSADPADWDANDVPIPWERVASESDVNGANKWFTDGATAYVYFEGGIAPVFNEDIFVIRDRIHNEITSLSQATPITVYQEGFHWLGGVETWGGVIGVKVRFYDCKFTNKLEQTKNIAAIRCLGVTDIRFNKCVVGYSWYDNFSYTNSVANATDPTFLELNCKSYSAGLRGGGSNQASTAHNDYVGLSINSEYSPTTQDAILDVNSSHRLLLAPKFIKEVNKELCLNVSDSNTRPSYCIRPRFTGMTNPEFRSHVLGGFVSQVNPADNVNLRSLYSEWVEMTASDFDPDYIDPPRTLTKINGVSTVSERKLDAIPTGGGSFKVFLPMLQGLTSIDLES